LRRVLSRRKWRGFYSWDRERSRGEGLYGKRGLKASAEIIWLTREKRYKKEAVVSSTNNNGEIERIKGIS